MLSRFCLVVLGLTLTFRPGWGQVNGNRISTNAAKTLHLPDFDIRDYPSQDRHDSVRASDRQLVERRLANLEVERRSAGGESLRVVPNQFGLPKLMLRHGGVLSGPHNLEPEAIAREFLRSHRSIFPFEPTELDHFRLLVKDITADAQFLAFNQTVEGIDVYNGQVKFTLSKAGEVVQISAGDVIPGINLSTKPKLSAQDAAQSAVASVSGFRPQSLSLVTTPNGSIAFRNPNGDHLRPIVTELAIVPVGLSSARLAYRIFVDIGRNSYEVLIDADDGSLVIRHRLNRSAAYARVWTQSPMIGSRQFVTLPPEWLTTTVTTGNNADAYVDLDGDDVPDSTSIPGLQNGRAVSVSQIFDFPYGDGLTGVYPWDYQPAAVTNLFYFINVAHDFFYGLGFTEAAGNFQTSNFGRGGEAGDPVYGEAQQGSEFNNSELVITPDGTSPIMRMGLHQNGTNVKNLLDSDYDGQVAIHEYTHGVNNRLVGSRTSTSCLSNIQSQAMDEGWSDYFAISFYNNPVFGAYLSQNPTTGLRRQSYDGYIYTYEDIGNGSYGYEPHDDGEIWAATLWDLRKSLGQAATDQLVMNGLKSTPCSPSMIDARDAILSADQAANSGANRTQIWKVFSRHGMGYSADGIDGDQIKGTVYNAAYDLPPDLQQSPNPKITSNPLQPLAMGGRYSYRVTATNPAGGTLSYALNSGPSGMTTDAGSGLTQWIAGFVGQRVKITVTDGKNGRVVHGFMLPVDTPLAPDAPLTLSGLAGDIGYAEINVPAGTPVLQVTLLGGTGDADLMLIDPTGMVVAYSVNDGNDEVLSVPTPGSGVWQVTVAGYTSFVGASLTARLITPQLLPGNAQVSGLSGAMYSENFYRVHVPTGATLLTVSTSGGTGDVDLLLKYGSPATCSTGNAYEPCSNDQSSMKAGNTESISISMPKAGDYYLDLSGYSDYSGVTLATTLVAPSTLSVSPTTLAFAANEGGAAPESQTISITGAGSAPYNWTAAATVSSGTNWLGLSRTSGTGDGSVQITVNPSGLAPGTYQGFVTITAPGISGSPQSVSVTLMVSRGSSGINLAQGKTATQSSTLPGIASAGANSAVDGNTDGNFSNGSVTATNLENNPWWQVDLGTSQTIGSVVLWNRTDCCGSRLSDFWVFVSSAPFLDTDTPSTLQNRAATFASHQTSAPNPSMSIAAATQGRYVRVQLSNPGYLSLAEVQVIGGTSATAGMLAVSSTHVGSFVQGQSTGAYTLSVSNIGSTATSGAVSVVDTLPPGLTASAITGPGWSCTLATLTCTRSDSLAAGSGYPPVIVTVGISSNAASPVTNHVSVSLAGAQNGTANDPTNIVPAFTDVSSVDQFLPAIDLLREFGITSGCGVTPPLYCSNDNIPESQMAVFVIRSIFGGDTFAYTPTPYFTDVPANYPYFPWIQKEQELGIAVPCSPPNQFCPDSLVSRGLMAALIIRSRYGISTPTNYPATPYFTDVPATHPYFPWIQKMKQLGITAGCGGTSYCPDDPVTRGQMAVFIMRGEFNQLLPLTTPIVTWVSPASASPRQTSTVTIIGQNTNFGFSTQVNAGSGVSVSNIQVINANTLTAQFVIASNAALGPRSITVTTGVEEATLPNGFLIR